MDACIQRKMIDNYYVNGMIYCLLNIQLTLFLYFKHTGNDVEVRECGTTIKREADA